MTTTTQPNPAKNHDEIARLAWHLWQQAGGQHGRDLDYWLEAERQFRTIRQPRKRPAKKRPREGGSEFKQA